jgi:hypothetical protein
VGVGDDEFSSLIFGREVDDLGGEAEVGHELFGPMLLGHDYYISNHK